ncbi:general secretion pathway protein GspD [Flavobacteriaceae bacterium MHTCC 0001]
MKKLFLGIVFIANFCFSQNGSSRIEDIKHQLDMLSVDNIGFTEKVKSEIQVSNVTLSNFLIGISEIHNINLNIANDLQQISIVNNFTDVIVADLLVFLCKEYSLTIDFSGNILSIKKYTPPVEPPKERVIPVTYAPDNNTISIDAKNDKLYDAFKRIMDASGKNLVFSPNLEAKTITFYVKDTPFDAAMEKLALANSLSVEKSEDNFYIFNDGTTSDSKSLNRKRKNPTANFKVLDKYNKQLEIDFNDTAIASIIQDLAEALDLNVFTASPLTDAGSITFKTTSITFDELLYKMFESKKTVLGNGNANSSGTPSNTNSKNRNNQNIEQNRQPGNQQVKGSKKFTFKKENDVYYFGTEEQLSVRSVEIIYLQHRSVALLSDPSGGSGLRNRTVGRTNGFQNGFSGFNNFNNFNNSSFNRNNQLNNTSSFNNSNFSNNSINNRINSSTSSETNSTDLLSLLPEDLKEDLRIAVDYELNSFYVSGAAAKIERFKAFIKKIDKPVPVVMIEVMIVEAKRNATVETGVNWGIGDAPTETKGNIFPSADFTFGANTINKVINGFDAFGSKPLDAKLVPNFFATVKAMESNGNLKIRSTPKLATLNGHKATFSNGQTSYYAITQRNIFGADNPQTSEITNYAPIDAELGLTIKPMVSGNGQITLDIFVVQSSFGTRIADDAPPDLISREFTSIIRVEDQGIAVLGGLEEREKNDSGSGVPFLARIPIIKWLFSQRKRTDSKSKLTVFIKPTVIY